MRGQSGSLGVWCAIVLVLALTVRIGLAARFVGLDSPPDRAASFDQMDYEMLAWRLAEGQGYTLEDGSPTARRMPGTSLALLPIYTFAGHNYMAARVWFCFLSALTCVASLYLGKFVFNQSVGILAGLMLAVYPNHAYYAMHFLSEGPGGLFATIATIATIVAWRPTLTLQLAAMAGVTWGVAGLFRPNVLLALPLCLLLAFAQRSRAQSWSCVWNMFAMCIVASMCLVPLVARNYASMGLLSISTVNAPTLWGAHNHRILSDAPGDWIPMSRLVDEEHPLSGTEVERSKQMMQYSREFIWQNLSSMPYLTLWKIGRFLSPFAETSNRIVYYVFAVGWIVSALCMLTGLAACAFRRLELCGPEQRQDPTKLFILMSPFLAMFITSIIYYGSIRFRDSASPNYIVLAAFGITVLVGRIWKRR